MKIEVRKMSDTEYEIEIKCAKLVPVKISHELYKLLESKVKNKSEFIRSVILQVISNNVDLTKTKLSNESRNKVISFRVDYQFYMKMIEYARRYEMNLNDFINKALWWGVEHYDNLQV